MFGYDISNNNAIGIVDQYVFSAKIKPDFVFHKATEGMTFKDQYHNPRVRVIRSRKILVGHYHFAWPDNNPVEEAEEFLNFCMAQPGDALMLDFEPYPFLGNLPREQRKNWYTKFPQWIIDFIEYTNDRTGARCILYLDENMGNIVVDHATKEQKEKLYSYPLCKAKYDLTPGTFWGWPHITMWQYSQYPLDLDEIFVDWNTFAMPELVNLGQKKVNGKDAFGCPHMKAWLPIFTEMGVRRGLIKKNWDIVQAQGGSSLSAGTHLQGTALDLTQDDPRVSELAREMGAASWPRGAKYGQNFDPHTHLIIDCSCYSSGDYQITAMKNGYNGLGNNGTGGKDYIKKPSQWRDWKTGADWAIAQLQTPVKVTTTVDKGDDGMGSWDDMDSQELTNMRGGMESINNLTYEMKVNLEKNLPNLQTLNDIATTLKEIAEALKGK